MAEVFGPILGVSGGGGGGSGTVTSFSFTNGSGFTGSVATPTTTPALSLTYSGAPHNVTAQSTTYTAVSGDIVLATAGSGGFTVTLPASTINRQVTVKKVDSGAGTITITPASGTIDGAASATIVTQYESLTMVADGTNWNLI